MAEALEGIDRLLAVQDLYDLKGRRDHAVDRKDWDTYARLHTEDFVSTAIAAHPITGGRAAADAIAKQLENVSTVHHCHTPVIEFQDRDHATGVWAMEDNLFWHRNGQKEWLRGYGFYYETYVRGADGQWRFSSRRLERIHVETSSGTANLAHDVSGEGRVGA